jgi:cysteine synthase A
LNPSGSTKDRIARHILEKAWRQGKLGPGDLVVEASSGSTSIALALNCAQMGLKFLAFIPDTATNERSLMIQAYGAEVRKVSGGMPEVIRTAAEFAETNGVFAARQFENPDNAEAHQLFTAHEMMVQLPDVNIDAVVSGIGTGGTLVGLHQGFTHAGCVTRPVAAIPQCADGEMASNVECCSLRFSKDVPGVMDGCSKIFADWRQTPDAADLREMVVDDCRCLDLTHQLWKMGFPVGPSSGLNLAAAMDAAVDLPEGATIVTVFPDRMERYFSHKVFSELS